MRNFVNEVPYKLPANIICPTRVDVDGYKVLSLAVYAGRRRKPLPLGKMMLWDHGDVMLFKSRYHSTRMQADAWGDLLEVFGGHRDLPVEQLTMTRAEP